MFFTSSPIADLLLIAIVAVMVGHNIYLRRKGRYLLLEPLSAFWGGCLVVYVVQPIAHYETFNSWHPPGTIEATLLWIFVGVISVVIGYELPLGEKIGYRFPSPPARLAQNKVFAAAGFMLFLAFVGMQYQASAVGGWARWLSVGRTAMAEGLSSYITSLDGFLPIAVIFMIIVDQFYGKPWSVRRIALWSLGVLNWWWFVYLGSRSRTIVFMMLLVCAYFLPKRKNPPLYFVLPLVIFLYFLSNFIAEYRSGFTNLSLNLDKIQWVDLKVKVFASVMSDDIDVKTSGNEISRGAEFNCVATVVELCPSRYPYSYGYGFLDYFTRPIPRAIWPQKRYPRLESYTPIMLEGDLSRNWVDYAYNPILAGPTFTFVGFTYSTGGPIGTIILGIVLGIMFRAFRMFYERDVTNQSALIFYIVLMQIGFNEAASEPFWWPMSLPLLLIPLYILMYLCRDRSESATNLPSLGESAG